MLGLLIVFPAQVFNSTYEANHERIDRRLAKLRFWRRRPAVSTTAVGAIPAQAPGEQAEADPVETDQAETDPAAAKKARRLTIFIGCTIIGTLLAGFLDPKFGANMPSFALLLGVFLAVILTILAVVLAGRVYRSASHHEPRWYLEAIPSALLIAVAGGRGLAPDAVRAGLPVRRAGRRGLHRRTGSSLGRPGRVHRRVGGAGARRRLVDLLRADRRLGECAPTRRS